MPTKTQRSFADLSIRDTWGLIQFYMFCVVLFGLPSLLIYYGGTYVMRAAQADTIVDSKAVRYAIAGALLLVFVKKMPESLKWAGRFFVETSELVAPLSFLKRLTVATVVGALAFFCWKSDTFYAWFFVLVLVPWPLVHYRYQELLEEKFEKQEPCSSSIETTS